MEPGTTIRMRYTAGLKGWVPCREGGVRNDCVALQVLSDRTEMCPVVTFA